MHGQQCACKRKGIAASRQTIPTPSCIPANHNFTRTHLHSVSKRPSKTISVNPAVAGRVALQRITDNYRRAPLRRRRPNSDAMPKAASTNALGSGTGVTYAQVVPPRISSKFASAPLYVAIPSPF